MVLTLAGVRSGVVVLGVLLLAGCASGAELADDAAESSRVTEPTDQPGERSATGGGTDPSSGSGSGPGSQTGGAPGAGGGATGGSPGQTEQPQLPSVGSPLRIPLPTDGLQGSVFADRRAELAALIATACGGTQCVAVAKVGEGTQLDGLEACDTIRRVDGAVFDEETGTPSVEVLIGGTVTVIVNVRCEDVTPSPLPVEEEPGDGSTAEPPPVTEPAPPEEPAPPAEPPPAGEPASPPLPDGQSPADDSPVPEP